VPQGRTSKNRIIKWFKENKRRIIVSACLAALLIFFGIPMYQARQSKYYRSFKGTKEYYATWKVSTHEKMSCIDCHVEPGTENRIVFIVKAVAEHYVGRFFSDEKNLFHKPSRQACQECHTTYRVVSASGDLLVPHRAHIEVLKMSCADCHNALVHTQNTKGVNTPAMDKCLKCHDGKKASDKCKSCHTEKAYPKSHQAKNWIEVHSEKEKEINCAKCHAWTPDFCKECHTKKPQSHKAGNWKKLHAGPAKNNSKRCMICHEKKKCLECHD
jgi:hypothetical protein